MITKIAEVEGIQRQSEDVSVITLQVREAGKTTSFTVLWYIPAEQISTYYLGQKFEITLQDIGRGK